MCGTVAAWGTSLCELSSSVAIGRSRQGYEAPYLLKAGVISQVMSVAGDRQGSGIRVLRDLEGRVGGRKNDAGEASGRHGRRANVVSWSVDHSAELRITK